MFLVDSHCHLDDPRFDAQRVTIMQRAAANNVRAIVIPGITAASWSRSRAVAEAHEGVYWAAGLHPYFLAQHRPEHLEQLRECVAKYRPVAIGECGLDFYIRDLDPALQEFYFAAQINIAQDAGLPVVVHARKAVDRVIQMLRAAPGVRAQIHSFSGSEQQAAQLIEAGHMLSFGASVLFDRARRLQRIAQDMPVEALLVETDAPDQPGPEHQGQLNEPAFLLEVVARIAQLRGITKEELAAQTVRNAENLFAVSFSRHPTET